MPPEPDSADPPWWRGATIYQIYPRSFQDSDGDGVGDLPGITQRLDHVASLGVDAIWVSPFYCSPMRDFGYDVSDYCDVDPVFGTLADFDAMIARAHGLGIRVIVDQVYSHCSSDHAWFAESRSSRDNQRADWYVWRDPKPDGSPPNNWQAVFGGPSWTWDGRRGQYYLHNFLPSQPQMNLHNPAVQDAMLGVARFWLERGVDGFRIDALNFAMFDPLLRDNPPAPLRERTRTRPFDFQLHVHDQFHADTVGFIARLRALADGFGATFTVGEVGGDEDNVEMKRFTRGEDRLNSAYGFDFLYAPALTPDFVAETMARWPGAPSASGEAEGWPSWAFENHDAPRAISRWCDPEHRARFVRVKMALLLALRGSVILYQGEELGLEQDEIPFELLRDPEAIANWPRTLSRDGARTPMPWRDEPLGGFTTGAPWLPLSNANLARAVATQEADPSSLLHFTREMLALRNAHPALRLGAFEACEVDGPLLSFERLAPGERLHCLFNLGAEPLAAARLRPDARLLLSVNGAGVGGIPGHSAMFAVV
ncbi:MAG: alpha-amylase family glycosyl hydrolase [Novosphingobium sp.]